MAQLVDREATTRGAMAQIRADLWRQVAEMIGQTDPDLEWFGEDDLIRQLYCYKAYRMLLSEVIQHKREIAGMITQRDPNGAGVGYANVS